MSSPYLLIAGLAACLAITAPADARRQRDGDIAFLEAQRGRILPLPRVERAAREHPAVRGADYLGPELNSATGVYRLKFMRAGRVIWVDVDGRTGKVLQTSGD